MNSRPLLASLFSTGIAPLWVLGIPSSPLTVHMYHAVEHCKCRMDKEFERIVISFSIRDVACSFVFEFTGVLC